jgi:beta-lactamase regulating signal transducer with metallopeptidase domain
VDDVLNWVWQGIVVAMGLSVALRCLGRARANLRYVVSFCALLLVLAIPVAPHLPPSSGAPQLQSLALAAPVVSVPAALWASDAAMLTLWGLWVGIYGIRVTRAAVGLRRARYASRRFPTEVERQLTHWMRIHEQRRRRARLVVSDDVGSAAVLGWGRPLIAVAPSLIERLSAAELDRVVVHEWAHVARRDDIAAVFQLVARLIAGWHPAIWWIERRLHVEREVACDEVAVSVTGSAKSYARCLVRLADLSAGTRAPLAAPGMLAGNTLGHRVTRIVSSPVAAPTGGSRALATLAIAALATLSAAIGGYELVAAVVVPQAVVAPRTSPAGVAAAPVTAGPRASLPRHGAGRVTARHARAVNRNEPSVPVSSPDAAVEDVSVDTRVGTSDVVSSFEAVVPPIESPHPELPAAMTPEESSNNPPADARPAWAAASDAGVAIGRSSKDAGLATATVFRRFARRVADSF